jgi:hypothetical protein
VSRAAGGSALTAQAGGREHETTAKLRERERLVARERAAAQAEERRLRGQRAQLAAEEQRVRASRLEEEAQRTAVATSERRAREWQKAVVEAEARAQRERQKAERLRDERLALPRYCCLHVPNPGWLGRERDQAESGRYLRLELARAWRIENPTMCRCTTRQATVARAHAARKGSAAVKSGSPKPNRQGWGLRAWRWRKRKQCDCGCSGSACDDGL